MCNARVDFYCTCNNNIHGKIKSYLLFAVRYALIYKVLISGTKSTHFPPRQTKTKIKEPARPSIAAHILSEVMTLALQFLCFHFSVSAYNLRRVAGAVRQEKARRRDILAVDGFFVLLRLLEPAVSSAVVSVDSSEFRDTEENSAIAQEITNKIREQIGVKDEILPLPDEPEQDELES